MGIKGARLSFVIPPGQRVFLPVVSSPSKQDQSHADDTKADGEAGDGQQDSDAAKTNFNVQLNTSDTTEPASPKKRKCEDEHGDCKRQRSQPPEADNQAASSSEVPENPIEAAAETASPSTTAEAVSSAEVAEISTATSEKPDSAGEAPDEPSVSVPEAPQASTEDTEKTPPANVSDANMDEILIENIQGLTSLASKIIEVDGRITDIPNGNAWKEFRAYRNNQDMGSLWEMRQAWFQRAGK